MQISVTDAKGQLTELVRRAEAERQTIRMVGTGHSWSDIALTEGFLLDEV